MKKSVRITLFTHTLIHGFRFHISIYFGLVLYLIKVLGFSNRVITMSKSFIFYSVGECQLIVYFLVHNYIQGTL